MYPLIALFVIILSAQLYVGAVFQWRKVIIKQLNATSELLCVASLLGGSVIFSASLIITCKRNSVYNLLIIMASLLASLLAVVFGCVIVRNDVIFMKPKDLICDYLVTCLTPKENIRNPNAILRFAIFHNCWRLVLGGASVGVTLTALQYALAIANTSCTIISISPPYLVLGLVVSVISFVVLFILLFRVASLYPAYESTRLVAVVLLSAAVFATIYIVDSSIITSPVSQRQTKSRAVIPEHILVPVCLLTSLCGSLVIHQQCSAEGRKHHIACAQLTSILAAEQALSPVIE